VPGFSPFFGAASESSTTGSSGDIPRASPTLKEIGIPSINVELLEEDANNLVLLGSIFSIEARQSLNEPAVYGGATHFDRILPR
jgi:hypothetical protein